ncbi:hypothetical protein DMC47_05935 [Nostoc sp. 3335mG]|nr:hypothetical protein DMC47_05935 [Nostoc sp. 3335mG]
MQLEDLFPSRRHRHDPLDSLAAQIAQLRRQSRSVSRSLSHDAGDFAEEFGDVVADFGKQAARQGAWLAGVASRKAVDGARAVQRDPVPVVAVVATAVLLSTLIFRRR